MNCTPYNASCCSHGIVVSIASLGHVMRLLRKELHTDLPLPHAQGVKGLTNREEVSAAVQRVEVPVATGTMGQPSSSTPLGVYWRWSP